MIKYYGLPNIWSRRIMEGRYNSLKIEQMLWKTMKWWWTQARKAWRGIITDMVRTRRSADPPWEEIGTVAMNVALRLGGWSARRFIEESRKRSGVGVPEVPVIQFQDFSPETWPFQDTAWKALEGETWVQYKDRVFSPLADQVMGVNTDFCDDYVAQRMPPIRDADELVRTRVRDLVARSEAEAWADGRLRDELQQAGNWPLARVRNQIRTETATMYNAGRMRHFADSDSIVGYEYVATIDNRTTLFCQEINGKTVRKEDLSDIPPFHFQCRTVTKPIFFWDKGYSFDAPASIPSPGSGDYMQWEGFGQKGFVGDLREIHPVIAPMERLSDRFVGFDIEQTDLVNWARRKYPNIEWNIGQLRRQAAYDIIDETDRLLQKYPMMQDEFELLTVTDLPENWYATTIKQGRGIALNAKYFGRQSTMPTETNIWTDFLQGYHPRIGTKIERGWDMVEGVQRHTSLAEPLTHEFGHAVRNRLRMREESRGLVAHWVENNRGEAHKISEYALANESEMFAESFQYMELAEYSGRQRCPPPARSLQKLLRDELGVRK